MTNLSTFQATVAAVCLVGILGLCCLGCLNSVGVKYFRRYNVLMARLTRDELECEQSRVSNILRSSTCFDWFSSLILDFFSGSCRLLQEDSNALRYILFGSYMNRVRILSFKYWGLSHEPRLPLNHEYCMYDASHGSIASLSSHVIGWHLHSIHGWLFTPREIDPRKWVTAWVGLVVHHICQTRSTV